MVNEPPKSQLIGGQVEECFWILAHSLSEKNKPPYVRSPYFARLSNLPVNQWMSSTTNLARVYFIH